MTGPTWYDVLGVDRTAGAEEIRGAWRRTIAELDPTDPRFKSANRAAEVLLDPERRAAYDADLPADEAEPEAATPSVESEASVEPDAATPLVEPEAASPSVEPDAATPSVAPEAGRSVPVWLLAVQAALVVLLLVPVVWLATKPSDGDVEARMTEAKRAAERALPTVLAYDHRSLVDDRAAASELLTPAYAEKYNDLFDAIEANADSVKPVVTAEVIASGVVRSDTEAERVSVFVFVDQTTRNAQTPADSPGEVWRNSVTVTMVERDDEWLVDGMETREGSAAPEGEPSEEPSGEPSEQPSEQPSEEPTDSE